MKLEDVSITFKNQQVLRGVSWDVKTGERVGLVGERHRLNCPDLTPRTPVQGQMSDAVSNPDPDFIPDP